MRWKDDIQKLVGKKSDNRMENLMSGAGREKLKMMMMIQY